MEHFEMAEMLSKKSGVSLEKARQALVDNDWDMLDAMVALEKDRAETDTVHVEAGAGEEDDQPAGKTQAVKNMARESRENAKAGLHQVWEYIRHVYHSSLDTNFCIIRKDKRILTMPVLALAILLVFGLFLHYLGLVLLLLVVGLFFGCQYHFEGKQTWNQTANNAMDKLSNAADDIRGKFTDSKDDDNGENKGE